MMMIRTQFNRDLLLTDAGLAAVYEAFDDLHDAVSEGQIEDMTPLDQRELLGWLRELVFTAQETIAEIEKVNAPVGRQPTVLRLVK
jgi:hypothetical protein